MRCKPRKMRWTAWRVVVGLAVVSAAPLRAQEAKVPIPHKSMRHDVPVTRLAYSADGKTLASGCSRGTIKLWDVATGNEQATLKGVKGAMVMAVAYSPGGKTLASANWTIKLWDVATGKEQATLYGHRDNVVSVAYSPDGKTVASGSLDQTIKLWDVASGK